MNLSSQYYLLFLSIIHVFQSNIPWSINHYFITNPFLHDSYQPPQSFSHTNIQYFKSIVIFLNSNNKNCSFISNNLSLFFFFLWLPNQLILSNNVDRPAFTILNHMETYKKTLTSGSPCQHHTIRSITLTFINIWCSFILPPSFHFTLHNFFLQIIPQ